jgi:hypothetical protein
METQAIIQIETWQALIGIAVFYDAENDILSVTQAIPRLFPQYLNLLKDGAFRVGDGLDSVLFVGGIYLRNQIFASLGFKLDELEGE